MSLQQAASMGRSQQLLSKAVSCAVDRPVDIQLYLEQGSALGAKVAGKGRKTCECRSEAKDH